jgi:FG-GAP-like repeat
MKKQLISWLLIAFIIGWQIPYYGCSNGAFADKNIEEGYELAKIHCVSCHRFPEPSLLNKTTWLRFVLPKMAPNVGYKYFMDGYTADDEQKQPITLQQWYNIMRYYNDQAPDSPLKRTYDPVIKNHTPLFTAVGVFAGFNEPATTLVKIDSLHQRILFGDGLKKIVYSVSRDLKITDSVTTGTGAANIHLTDTGWYILNMGVLHPSDALAGNLLITDASFHKTSILLDSLQRPVHALYTDLNNDSREDIIVCEFGNQSGYLGWFENEGKRYKKHILRPLPGAIKTVVYDFNGDGKKDILALMAQGDEGLYIYYNQGNNAFKEERILRFPPSYGSNSFELLDFNNDGFPDIITTNGDNGDYPPIYKNYHGIRIFLNDGKNAFTEKVFLPVNGAGKVIAADFDADGDLDLASIAYFPDFVHKPQEAFIYWENKGNWQFEPSTIDKVSEGRWLTMDAGDIDADGDIDIVLGNTDFMLGDVPAALKQHWDTSSPSILVLKNNLH